MYDIHIDAAIALTRAWEIGRPEGPERLTTKDPFWQGKTVAEVLMDPVVLTLILIRAEREFKCCQGLKPHHIRVFRCGTQEATDWEVVTKIRGYVYFATQ